MMIYQALIRSRLEYGGFLMQNISDKMGTRLDKIQLRGLRATMDYRQSTPINIVLGEAKEPPLVIRYKFLCKKYHTYCDK